MSGRKYELRVRAEFAAAHVLRGYAGACDRVHGHTFKVEAELVCEALDGLGMSFDFHELERLLKGAIEPLDHRMLNDVAAFEGKNPTAERIAEYVFARLSAALEGRDGADPPNAGAAPSAPVRVSAITVAESDRFSVRVSQAPDDDSASPPSADSSGGP